MAKEKFDRTNPKNREAAFTYQFEDDVKMLKVASLSGEKQFEQALATLEIHIQAYRSKRLRKICDKAVAKSKEMEAYMANNFPKRSRNVKFKTVK